MERLEEKKLYRDFRGAVQSSSAFVDTLSQGFLSHPQVEVYPPFRRKVEESSSPEEVSPKQTGGVELSIIVVTYKARDYVLRTLESIRKYPPKKPYEVLVLDNHSEDGTKEAILERFILSSPAREPQGRGVEESSRREVESSRSPEVGGTSHPRVGEQASEKGLERLVVLPQNLGLIVARNLGVKMSRGRFLMFLDSDIEVCAGTLDKMYGYLVEHQDQEGDSPKKGEGLPRVGLVIGKLTTPGGMKINNPYSFPTLWTWGMELFWPFSNSGRRRWRLLYERKEPRVADWGGGGFCLTSREVMNTIGLQDERYFFFCEDIDFCYRAGQAGFSAVYFPQAVGIHYGSRSTTHNLKEKPKFRFYNLQSKLTYARKTWTPLAYTAFAFLISIRLWLLMAWAFFFQKTPVGWGLLAVYQEGKRIY